MPASRERHLEPGQWLWCHARLAEVVSIAHASLSQPGDARRTESLMSYKIFKMILDLFWLFDFERVQYHKYSEPTRFFCKMRKMLTLFGYFCTLALAFVYC